MAQEQDNMDNATKLFPCLYILVDGIVLELQFTVGVKNGIDITFIMVDLLAILLRLECFKTPKLDHTMPDSIHPIKKLGSFKTFFQYVQLVKWRIIRRKITCFVLIKICLEA